MLSVNRVQLNNTKNTLSFKSGHYEMDPYLLAANCDPNDLALQLELNQETSKSDVVQGQGIIKSLKENYQTLLGILFDDKTTKQAKKVDESLTKIVQSGAIDTAPKNKINFKA